MAPKAPKKIKYKRKEYTINRLALKEIIEQKEMEYDKIDIFWYFLDKRTGLKRTTVQNWYNKSINPRSVNKLEKLVDFLGCNLDDILIPYEEETVIQTDNEIEEEEMFPVDKCACVVSDFNNQEVTEGDGFVNTPEDNTLIKTETTFNLLKERIKEKSFQKGLLAGLCIFCFGIIMNLADKTGSLGIEWTFCLAMLWAVDYFVNHTPNIHGLVFEGAIIERKFLRCFNAVLSSVTVIYVMGTQYMMVLAMN